MEYVIEEWPIERLIELFEQKKLNLNPPYQRNEIWPIKAKQLLINSIKKNYPIPNFFLFKKKNGSYDIVDGQQRTRSILGYYKKFFPDLEKNEYEPEEFPEFLTYRLSVIIIIKMEKDEKMERFYFLINSTGLKLNRPELKKAEYFDKKFQSLLENLSTNEKFQSFQLFPEASIKRMTDVDLIGELVCQIKYGITEKKIYVDKMYEEDISDKDYNHFFNRFEKIIDILDHLNNIYPLNKTRYKQRNDFYTLFGFINKNLELDIKHFEHFYNFLVLIGTEIYPSNENCEQFKEYALNCVTQSNSKKARKKRSDFFNQLLLNIDDKANETQKSVLESYGLNVNDVEKIGKFTLVSFEKLQRKIEEQNYERE